MDGEPCPRTWGQDEVNGLHVGLLLYGKDFFAIRDSLLPELEVDDIVQFYCSTYRYTKACTYVQKLEQQGFQPGSLLSGNMRNRVLNNLTAATGLILRTDKLIASSFKGYDACSLPLVGLVEALTRGIGAATFSKAVFQELDTCGVDKDKLSLSELFLDLEILDEKIREDPALFITALWPALAGAGWKQERPAASGAGAADAVSATDNGEEQACDVLYFAPDSVADKYQAAVGEPLEPCRTPEAVVEALAEAGEPVPTACITALRELELEEAIRDCLLYAGHSAAHRHVHDPSTKRPGTPTTSRKFMCANCSINSSTVWRTGNAGLTLCNACGMFYNKHDHEHRPEHLIASARAKAEAQQNAAAVSGANICGSPLRKGSFRAYTPDMGNTDGELSDDAGSNRGGSYLGGDDTGDEEQGEGKRPRRRRRAQVSKWLATDDYLMLDGPLRTMSNQDPAGGYNSTPYANDDGRYGSYDAQRGRYTSSPNFVRSRRGRTGSYGAPYFSRSRSVDPDYYGWAQGQDDYGWYDEQQNKHQQDHVLGRQQDGIDMECNDVEQQQEADLQLQRPLEDMESLLGRILLQSPSDASDSSAADALVAMSHSSISQREQRRLHSAISCDIQAASASPVSLQRPLPPALAATVSTAAGGISSAGASLVAGPSPRSAALEVYKGWDAAAKIEVPGRSGLAIKPLAIGMNDLKATTAMIDDPAGDMQVDAGSESQERKQEAGALDSRPAQAAVATEGFEQVWAKLHPLATGRDSRGSEQPGANTAAAYDSPHSWYEGGQQYHDSMQHCHSAPSHYGPTVGGLDYVQTAGASSMGAYQYGSGQYVQQYQSQDEDLYYQEGGHSGLEYNEDGGSRTGTPKHAGKNNSGSRRNQQVDEDYPEPRGKNRTISRFGAEHKQQLDYPGGSCSQPTTPQKRERGSPLPRSIRRTTNGEPQRCANCSSEHTCLWRRDKEDPTRTLCNACGIYKTNNGIDRPTNGLFPSWKNGKERVVRRNVARPIYKPYKHQVLSADKYKAQRQHNEHQQKSPAGSGSSKAGSHAEQQQDRRHYQQQQQSPRAGEIHPGAIGLQGAAAGLEAGEGLHAPAAAASLVGPKGVDPSILAELTAVARSSMQAAAKAEAMPLQAIEAATSSSNDAAVVSAAVAAATSAAKARVHAASAQLSQTGSPVAAASAPVTAITSSSTLLTAAAAAGEVAGNAQGNPKLGEMAPTGVLSSLIQQAWTHAVRMNEPVMLPTGHKVFPDGQVVKCHINNASGMKPNVDMPAATQ